MRLVNTISAIYGVMNYSLLLPNMVAFHAKLNEIYIKNEFHFALEVSFSIHIFETKAFKQTYLLIVLTYVVGQFMYQSHQASRL